MKRSSWFIFVFICLLAITTTFFSGKPENFTRAECFAPSNQPFAVQDSASLFYEQQCIKLMQIGLPENPRSGTLKSRGFQFDVSFTDRRVMVQNKSRDKYHWWIDGSGILFRDEILLRCAVKSPQSRT